MIENDSDLVPKSSNYYECSCGKMYKYDSGYYRHKKKCTNLNVILNNDEIKDKDELIIQLLKQNSELIKDNKEFKNMMIDVIKMEHIIQPYRIIIILIIKHSTYNYF
jgi:hypothetical protein